MVVNNILLQKTPTGNPHQLINCMYKVFFIVCSHSNSLFFIIEMMLLICFCSFWFSVMILNYTETIQVWTTHFSEWAPLQTIIKGLTVQLNPAINVLVMFGYIKRLIVLLYCFLPDLFLCATHLCLCKSKYVMSKWESDVIFACQSHFSPWPESPEVNDIISILLGLALPLFPGRVWILLRGWLSWGLNAGKSESRDCVCQCVRARGTEREWVLGGGDGWVIISKVSHNTGTVSQKLRMRQEAWEELDWGWGWEGGYGHVK